MNLLISGLPPGASGTGRLIEYLRLHYSHLFEFIHFGGPFDKELKKFLFKITNFKVLLIHPQTIGFDLFKHITEHNITYLYVMDNSFFCGSSYNVVKGENEPCFRCLNDKKSEIDMECTNFWNFKDFKSFAHKIKFLAQNKEQAKLLYTKFSSYIDVNVVGLNISDINSDYFEPNSEESFDIVYHGSNHFSKGYEFAKELNKKLGQDRVYFPGHGETWSTGLREKVQKAKIVLNPSIWSSSVEGALLKSIRYNGCVAVCKVKNSFVNEIPSKSIIILNSQDINYSTQILNKFLDNFEAREKIRHKSNEWLERFLFNSSTSIKKYFIREFDTNKTMNKFINNEYVTKQNLYFNSRISDEEIIKFNTNYVFSLSLRTKYLIKNNFISPKYIIDSNKELHGKYFEGTEIISPSSRLINNKDKITIISYYSINIFKFLTQELGFDQRNIYWS